MVDEERCPLVVFLQDASEADFKTFMETLAEDAEDGDDGTDGGDGQFEGRMEVVPSEHHEGDCSSKESEGNQRGKVEGEAAFGIAYYGFGGSSIGLAHTLLERGVVVVAFKEDGTECRRKSQGVQG